MLCSKCGAIADERDVALLGKLFATRTGAIMVGDICSDCLYSKHGPLWQQTTPQLVTKLLMPANWFSSLPIPNPDKVARVLKYLETQKVTVIHPDRGADIRTACGHANSILVASSNLVVSASKLADALGDEVFAGHATRDALVNTRGILGVVGIFGRAYPRPTESEIVTLLEARRDDGKTTVLTTSEQRFDSPVLASFLNNHFNMEAKIG